MSGICKRQVDREVEDTSERLRIIMEEKTKLEDKWVDCRVVDLMHVV